MTPDLVVTGKARLQDHGRRPMSDNGIRVSRAAACRWNAENLFGQGIGVHEILIGPLQALGVTRSVMGLPFLQIIVEALQDMQTAHFHHVGVEVDPEVEQKILSRAHLG